MILSTATTASEAPAALWILGVPSVLALLGYAAAITLGERFGEARRWSLVGAWVAHAVALVVDIAGVGSTSEVARFGFAPALSLTLWMVVGVYVIESRLVPLPGVRRVLAALGVLVVALAWIFPGELRPQVPYRWAPLHWVLGIASYGLFGAAVLHAAMLSRAERRLRTRDAAAIDVKSMPLMRLERLTFRFVGVGFAVLSAAIVLGVGSTTPWRWDHKTVFSMAGWLVFALLLGGRRTFGWRGPAVTRWVYAGAALLLLAYVGSRFVFEVLLHRPPSA